jgi:hypothetical protein
MASDKDLLSESGMCDLLSFWPLYLPLEKTDVRRLNRTDRV